MARKNALTEANDLTAKKRSFALLLTAKQYAAQKNIVVIADNQQQAITWASETYTGYVVTPLFEAMGAPII